MDLDVYNLLSSAVVSAISNWLLVISMFLVVCAFFVRWILKKPISFGLNIIWDRLERAKNLRLLPQYSAYHVYKILDSLAIIPWLICPLIFIYYVLHWNDFSQYIFSFKHADGENIISALSNYFLHAPIIIPFIFLAITFPFVLKILFKAIYIRIVLPEPKNTDNKVTNNAEVKNKKRKIPILGYVIFICSVLLLVIMFSIFNDMLVILYEISDDVVKKVNSENSFFHESVTLYIVATSFFIFIFSILIPVIFLAFSIIRQVFKLEVKEEKIKKNGYQAFPSWWVYANLFYGGFVLSVGLTIFTAHYFTSNVEKTITLQLVIVNAILDGATLAITRKILYNVSLPWLYVRASLGLKGISSDAREIREVKDWKSYSRDTKWRIYNSAFTEDRMNNLLFRLSMCVSEIRAYGEKEESRALLIMLERIKEFIMSFRCRSYDDSINDFLFDFRYCLDSIWEKEEAKEDNKNKALTNIEETSSDMAEILYLESNKHSWRKAIFFGFPVDFIIASSLAILSLYLGLIGSIYHIDFSSVLDLYFGFFSEARMGQLGGYIWLMHSALLPTTILWLALMLMIFASYIIAPVVNRLSGIRNNIGEDKFAENGVVAASKSLTNTAAFFAFFSGVPKVILFLYSVV